MYSGLTINQNVSGVCRCGVILVVAKLLIKVSHFLYLAYTEENGRIPAIIATGMPKTGELVFFEVESRLHMDYLEKVTNDITEAVKHVYHQLNSIILQKREIR